MMRQADVMLVAIDCNYVCVYGWMRGAGGHPDPDILVYAFRCMCFKQFAINTHS